MASDSEVADWMIRRLNTGKPVYKSQIVYQIRKRFGEAFVYKSPNHNLLVSKTVMGVFHRRTKGLVIWDNDDKCWRNRVESRKPVRTP